MDLMVSLCRQEAMNMTDGDTSHDLDELEADGFLDDIDSDGHEDPVPSSLVESADDNKCSSVPNGELVNDGVLLPLENDIFVEINCDTTNDVDVRKTSDVSEISDGAKTGDVTTVCDTTKQNTYVANEALPDNTALNSCQVSKTGDKQNVDELNYLIEPLEAKNEMWCASLIEKDEVKSVVSNKSAADAADAVDTSATKTIESPAVIASHQSEYNTSTVIPLANSTAETALNLNEEIIKKEATEVTSSSRSEITSSNQAVDIVDVAGKQSSADVPQIHQNKLTSVTKTLKSNKADEIVRDVTTESLPVEEQVKNVGPESLSVVEVVDEVSTEVLPETDSKNTQLKEDNNQLIEPVLDEQTTVKELPKIEYEASLKQLSLLNRLAMLKEKAGQRKSTTDGETSEGSEKTSSLPVSPTGDVTVSLETVSKDATTRPVTIDKTTTMSSIRQPVDKLSSASVAEADLQKPVADVSDSKRELKTSCKEVLNISMPSNCDNVDLTHVIKTSCDSDCHAQQAIQVDTSVKSTPMITTNTIGGTFKTTEEISSKVKTEMNSINTATPGTTSKSLNVTEVMDTVCKIPQESSDTLASNKPTELSQAIAATPRTSSDKIHKTEEKRLTSETKSVKPRDNAVKLEESEVICNDAVKSDDSLTKASSLIKAETNNVLASKNIHHESDAVDLLARQVVNVVNDCDLQSKVITNQQGFIKITSDTKLSKEINLDTKAETQFKSTEHETTALMSQPLAAVKQTIEKDKQKALSTTDVSKQQDPIKECEDKHISSVINQPVIELVPPSGHQLCPVRSLSSRVRTAGRRLDTVFSSIYDASVTADYDSDLDIAGTNEKTYTLVDRVRRLKASPVETPGYLYVFTDSPTEDEPSEYKVTGVLPRFKVGASRFPGKRLQQATCFNPEIKPFIVASVKRRLGALRLAREKLAQFQVTGTCDWFACDEDVMVTVIDTVVDEMKA